MNGAMAAGRKIQAGSELGGKGPVTEELQVRMEVSV